MSVQNQRRIPKIYLEVQIVNEKLDMILGFFTGLISMGIIALIIGVAFLETQAITAPVVAVVALALVSLLLLRGVPIKEITIKDYVQITFTVSRYRDDED